MFFSNLELISQKIFIVMNFPDRTKILLVRSGGPGSRTKNPDQVGPVRNSGPSDRTKNKMVLKSMLESLKMSLRYASKYRR